MQTQAHRQPSFSAEQQRATFAQLVMVDTQSAVKLLSASDETEALVASLADYPGALERLAFADFAPKWLKSLVHDVCNDADCPILT